MSWCDIISVAIAVIIFFPVLIYAFIDGWWVLWFWFLLLIPCGGWGGYRYGPVWYNTYWPYRTPIILQTAKGTSTDETTTTTEKTQLIF